MGAWITDYLANWAGEWGMVLHVNSQYRNPAFTGDVTYQMGEIEDKFIDDQGRHIAQVRHVMTNQHGVTLARGIGEVILPKE
jgi:hypothetical protein